MIFLSSFKARFMWFSTIFLEIFHPLGYLRVAQPLHTAHHEHFPAPVRHVVDGIHNPRETKVGVKVLLGQRLIRKIPVGKIQMRLPGLGSIYGHIRCHPEQVGADPCDIHKRVADKPQPHKHTLCDILRIIIRLEK